MSYNLVELVLVEMITSKDFNVNILKNDSEFIVIDSVGLYDAKGFKTLEESKQYIKTNYNLKASK